jgi:hypothetical protein
VRVEEVLVEAGPVLVLAEAEDLEGLGREEELAEAGLEPAERERREDG